MTTEPSSPDRRKLLVALGFGAANALALSKVAKSATPTIGRVRTLGNSATGPASPPEITGVSAPPAPDHVFDRVITGGRVIDPDSGFDRRADVGIDGGTIGAISETTLHGRATIDAKGRVVSPGSST